MDIVTPEKKSLIGIKVAILVLSVLCAILISFVYLYAPARSAVQDAWSVAFLPTDLKQSWFVVSNERILRTPSLLHFSPVALASNEPVVSVVRHESSYASIHLYPGGNYQVRLNGTPLLASKTPKAHITFSPDQKYVAYSELDPMSNIPAEASKEHPAYLKNPMWEVVLYAPATGERKVMGTGFAPFFVDASSVFWFTSEGIMQSPVSGTSTPALVLPIAGVASFPVPTQSADRTLISWVDSSHVATVGRVHANSVETVTTVKNTQAQSLMLSNTALYMVQQSAFGAQIWKHTLDGTTLQHVGRVSVPGGFLTLIP